MAERKRLFKWMIYTAVFLAAMMLIVLLGPELMKGQKSVSDSTTDKSVIPYTPIQTVRLLLDSAPNASHAYIFAADANGYFQEQGLSLNIITPNPTADPFAIVGAGQAELGLVHQPQVLLARNRNIPVISIAAVIRRPLTYMTVPQGSPIHSPSDLEGKKIALAQYSFHEAIVRTMLKEDDVDPATVTFTSVSGAYDQILKKGEADAMIGPSILRDRIQLEREGIAVRMIEPMLYGVPNYYDTVLVANEGKVEENKELYSKIWTALAKGQEYVLEHQEEALRLVINRQSKTKTQLDWGLERESLKELIPFMDAGDETFGYQSNESWSELDSWLTELELIDSSLDSEDAYVNMESNIEE